MLRGLIRGRWTARLAVAVMTAVAGVVAMASPSLASSTIDVPPGNQLFLTVHGVGQQIYQCAESDGSFSWTLLRPAAVLFKANGSVFGVHTYTAYQGQNVPTWAALDGSWVQGEKIASEASPNGPTNIPWLLVQAVAHGSVTGSLTPTTYVQRTDTVGGAAPSSSCGQSNEGAVQGSNYSAEYSFYEAST
jgi:hypothetical protein